MINLNEFAKEVHANSISKGWWESPRKFSEITSLIHSEWSEALEEFRNHKPMIYYACGAGAGYCDCDGHPSMEMNTVCIKDAYKECNYRLPKPEGIAVELIDGCIRVLDYLGWANYNVFPPTLEDQYNLISARRKDKIKDFDLPDLVAQLHSYTSNAFTISEYSPADTLNHCDSLLATVLIACYWLKIQGVDAEQIMSTKHEYNKTRSFKHGNKAI